MLHRRFPPRGASFLLLFALGLATLDVTFLVTQRVVEHLPAVTRHAPEAGPAIRAASPALRTDAAN